MHVKETGDPGGVAMRWFDSGVKNAEIRAAGDRLKSGMAALVVLTEEGSEEFIAEKLRLNGGNMTDTALTEEEAASIEETPDEPTTASAESAAA